MDVWFSLLSDLYVSFCDTLAAQHPICCSAENQIQIRWSKFCVQDRVWLQCVNTIDAGLRFTNHTNVLIVHSPIVYYRILSRWQVKKTISVLSESLFHFAGKGGSRAHIPPNWAPPLPSPKQKKSRTILSFSANCKSTVSLFPHLLLPWKNFF